MTGGTKPRLQRSEGEARVAWARREDTSALKTLYQRTPCRVLFPREDLGQPPTAVFVTTSGGVTGGDLLRFSAHAQAGTTACATTQAAEKIYRSTGDDARLELHVQADAGATLEWLPQETIVFEDARLRRHTRIVAGAGARVLALEMVVLGRLASGERYSRGLLFDRIDVELEGELRWRDALRLDDARLQRLRDDPAGLGGAVAFATIINVGEDAEAVRDMLRERLDGQAGVTLVSGICVARFLDADAQRLRRTLTTVVEALRAERFDHPPKLPRVWYT